MKVDVELDTSGMMCPLPLLRLKKALQTMQIGEVVGVVATDPAATLDFGVFLEQSGHSLLERSEQSGVLRFVIRKQAQVSLVRKSS
jgi:tRNA 2-thiouridine synthesizing protein A